MKSIPKISIVMSVYNGEKTIKFAINSILNQSFEDYEFIIINDGSTDNTLNILESYNDERIKIITQSNIGLTKSLNKAILLTKSNFIARQDVDELSHHSRLEIQYNYLKKNDSISLVGSRANIIDGKLRMVTKKINNDNISQLLMRTNIFIHGTVMFKKKDFLDIGLYNSKFKYTQDYEAWLRMIIDYKYKGIVLDDVLLTRKIIKDSISKNKFIYQSINGFIIRSKYINFLENIFISFRHILISIISPNAIYLINRYIRRI